MIRNDNRMLVRSASRVTFVWGKRLAVRYNTKPNNHKKHSSHTMLIANPIMNVNEPKIRFKCTKLIVARAEVMKLEYPAKEKSEWKQAVSTTKHEHKHAPSLHFEDKIEHRVDIGK